MTRILRRRHTLGIQARLTLLTLVTVLPLVALASITMLGMVDDRRAQIESDVRQRIGSFLADVDRQLGAIQAELQVLATSPSLQTGDFRAFDEQMRAALAIRGTSIVLHDTRGQQLLSTARLFGEPLPRATNTEMLDRVVAAGKPQISDLIMGAVLRRPILVVGVPVFRDERIGNGDRAGNSRSVAARTGSFARLDCRNIRSQRHYRSAQSRSRSLSRQAGWT